MIELEIFSAVPDEVELAQRYWAMNEEGKFKENVADLLPFGSIRNSSQLVAFVKKISTARDQNQTCPKCGGNQEIASRSNAKKVPLVLRRPCVACQAEAEALQHQAEELAEAELQRRIAPVIERKLAFKIDYRKLPDNVALILIALERAINPRLFGGHFKDSECQAIAPSMNEGFIIKLFDAQAILDDARRAKKGTYSFQGDRLFAVPRQMVYFLAPDTTLGATKEAFEVLSSRPFDQHPAIRNLWLDYAVADCMRYWFDQSRLHGLDTDEEHVAEMESTLRTALETYGVGQIWSMLWKIVRDAVALAARTYYTRDKAAATMPGKMRRHLEKVVEPTKVPLWNRPDHQPAGTLGQVFSEMFGIDEETPGAAVMTMFADPEPSSDHELDPSAEELFQPANDLWSRAVTHNIVAEVTLFFADAIRGGGGVLEAFEEVLGAFPVLNNRPQL